MRQNVATVLMRLRRQSTGHQNIFGLCILTVRQYLLFLSNILQFGRVPPTISWWFPHFHVNFPISIWIRPCSYESTMFRLISHLYINPPIFKLITHSSYEFPIFIWITPSPYESPNFIFIPQFSNEFPLLYMNLPSLNESTIFIWNTPIFIWILPMLIHMNPFLY